MSDDRLAQARAEAERRWKKGDDRATDFQHTVGCIKGFTQGVVWADANPQPHTITRAELAEAFARAGTNEVTSLLRELGIEVRDE